MLKNNARVPYRPRSRLAVRERLRYRNMTARWAKGAAHDNTTLRRLWRMYQRILTDDGVAKHDRLLAQDAVYNGARSVLKVLADMFEHGEVGRATPHFGRPRAADRR